jgi:uncharacterized protein (DUF58 family)
MKISIKQALQQRIVQSLTRRRKPVLTQRFAQRLLYIVPTAPGWGFGALVFALLVGSLNFKVNLGFLLTFLLFTVGFMSIYLTFQNLNQLDIHCVGDDAIFMGQTATFTCQLSVPNQRKRFSIAVYQQGDPKHPWHLLDRVHVVPKQPTELSFSVPTEKRGLVSAPLLQVKTVYPFGIWRVWGYFYPQATVLVYPKPEDNKAAILEQLPEHQQAGDDEFSGIRPYQKGDSASRIAWKLFFRTGQMFTRLYDPLPENHPSDSVVFDYDLLPNTLNKEEKLSRLCRLVLEASQMRLEYTLKLPNETNLMGEGKEHEQNCLKALALFN